MRRSTQAVVVAMSLAVASCSGQVISADTGPPPAAVDQHEDRAPDRSPDAVGSPAAAPVPVPGPTGFPAARLVGTTDVFGDADAVDPIRTMPSQTILGTPTVVKVLRYSGERLHVMLPGRPNGATGWVNRGDVVEFTVPREVIVDLSDRRLVVLEEDEVVYETSVGIGSTSSPTPTGEFFITDAVIVTRAGGPWGPYAFGLSARSDAVTEFNGGDGIIGIHGTNRPGSIGRAQSLGCVRLTNQDITELFPLLSVGTPVEIRN